MSAHPYAVLVVGGGRPWLHSVYGDLRVAALVTAHLGRLRPAALVRVSGPRLTVLDARGCPAEALRWDRAFLAAAQRAIDGSPVGQTLPTG
jgi:hypothetical protein